jgi:hypothetical protein
MLSKTVNRNMMKGGKNQGWVLISLLNDQYREDA